MGSLITFSRAFLAAQFLNIVALALWCYAFSQVPAELRGRGAWRLFLAVCGKPLADLRPSETEPLALLLRRTHRALACFLASIAIWGAWYVAYLVVRK